MAKAALSTSRRSLKINDDHNNTILNAFFCGTYENIVFNHIPRSWSQHQHRTFIHIGYAVYFAMNGSINVI